MADEMLARSLRRFTMDLKLTVRALLKEGRCSRPRLFRFVAACVEMGAVHVPQQKKFGKVVPLALHSEAEGRDDPDHLTKIFGWATDELRIARRSREWAGRKKPHSDFRQFDWRLEILSAASLLGNCRPGPTIPLNFNDEQPYFAACDLAFAIATGMAHFRKCQVSEVQVEQHSALVDIFGPKVVVPPAVMAWNDGTVPKLAAGIHADKAFDRMPILADACEDAGLDDANLLEHLRCPPWGQKHWLGCYALEALRPRL